MDFIYLANLLKNALLGKIVMEHLYRLYLFGYLVLGFADYFVAFGVIGNEDSKRPSIS